MSLFPSFPKIIKKESPKEISYLGLVLTPQKVLACVWGFGQDESIEIFGYGEKSYENTNNLVHQAAIAIDTAGQKARSDVSKVVFGLSYDWFEDGKLSEHASGILKSLSEDLELDSQAFVSLAASINHLLKIEESVTPHAVLVGVFSDFCEVHLIENNEVKISKTAKGQFDLEKISQLVKELKNDDKDLPARFIIYGLPENSAVSEKIAKHNWRQLFIHEPKITFLTDEKLVKSTTYAQAEDILGHAPVTHVLSQKESKTEVTDIKEKEKPSADEFGFVEGEDILETAKTQKPILLQDKKDLIPEVNSQPLQEEAVIDEKEFPREPETSSAPQVKQPDFKEGLFTLAWFPKIFGILKNRPSPKKIIVTLLTLLLVLFIGIFLATQTIVSDEVIIKVNVKSLEKDFKANVVNGNSADLSKSQISGEEISAKADGSQKAVTTGNKKIGEKAKGQITVFNWTTSPTKFSKGTTVISKNGIKFTIDSDIEVASRSASIPGQENTQVIAADFGQSGNIGANNDFTFQQYDELLYSARNNEAFTGGDEKQVTVVSKDDLAKLEKSLTDSLTEKSKTSLKEKTSGKKLYDEAILIKILKKEFDKKQDEEASLVNLNMEVEAQAIIFDQSRLKDLLAYSLKEETPQNMETRPENIEILDVGVKRQNSILSLSGKFRAGQIPKFDEDQLKSKIVGKSLKETRAIVKEIPEVTDVEVKYHPNLPFISSISKNKAKITFKIEAK